MMAAADTVTRARFARLRSWVTTVAGSSITLWLVFGAVHLWLGYLNLYGPGLPMGDVTYVYLFWVERGLLGGEWVGIDTSWVYPMVALLPMLAAYMFGPALYGSTWLTLVMVLNAAALVAIIGVHERARHRVVAWWWMLFLVLLGPITVGRIDAITVPLVMVAVMVIAHHPRWGGALLAVGAWIKVWPAGVILAAVIALRERGAVLGAAVGTTMLVVAASLALGGISALFTPITEQTGRGLQVEAPVSTLWLWMASAGEWGARVSYDHDILTWQVTGAGSADAAAAMTPLLAVVIAVIATLGVVAMRRGVDEVVLFPPLTLAMVMSLITVNKVGSPQFATWIAVPVVLGLAWQSRGGLDFRVPSVLALATATLTQLVYPTFYGNLLALDTALLVVLTARNLLYVALLGWAVSQLVVVCRRPQGAGVRVPALEGASS